MPIQPARRHFDRNSDLGLTVATAGAPRKDRILELFGHGLAGLLWAATQA